MTDKIELNDEELEKASGGYPDYSGFLTDFIIEAYDELEAGCFYIDTSVISESSKIAYINSYVWIYSEVNRLIIINDILGIPGMSHEDTYSVYEENEVLEFKQKYPYKLKKVR